MYELFDTTGLRQAEALRRHVAEADAAGQGDLFAETIAPTAAMSFEWPRPVGAIWTREDVIGMLVLA